MTITAHPDPQRSGYDCIVVGAGIVGVCTALELQRGGARVALIDAGAPGSGASFGNAGILVNTNLRPVFAGMTPVSFVQMLRNPASPLNVRWLRFPAMAPWFLRMLSHAGPTEVARITRALASLCQPGAGLYDELDDQAGIGDLMQAKGNVALNRSETERDAHWDKLVQIRELGVQMEKVGRRQLARLVPSVNPAYTHGIHSPAFRHSLDPQALVARLFERFQAQGGVFVQQQVTDILRPAGRAAGSATPGGDRGRHGRRGLAGMAGPVAGAMGGRSS